MAALELFDDLLDLESSLSPPPPPPPPLEMLPVALPPLAIYPSKEDLYDAIQNWSKPRGYAFAISRSKRLHSGNQRVYYACDRSFQSSLLAQARSRATQLRGTGCPFAILAIELPSGLGQPLDVSCFSSLKHVYSQYIKSNI